MYERILMQGSISLHEPVVMLGRRHDATDCNDEASSTDAMEVRL